LSAMTRVKICGITNLEDALAAIEGGADALGFVFAPSPRQVTTTVVRDIVGKLPPFVCKVGVFVDGELAQVQEVMSTCGLDLAQLHGEEDAEYCAALFPRAVKVFTGSGLPPAQELGRYRVAAYMVDRDKTASASESDLDHIWQLARQLGDYGPVILAGGLTPETVRRAIEAARPYAVDVSSGVEAEPGKKDHDQIRAFLEAAKPVKQGGSLETTR
jgi:phosphoribosylanthranilate isomerase